MGRMLETLKNGDHARGPLAGGECVVDWSMPEPAEIPYIEVGGPQKMEASPQVLATKHSAQARMQPPHPPTEKNLLAKAPAPVKAVTKMVQMAETRPMAVSFEAWPGTKKITRAVAAEIVTYHQPEHAIAQQYLGLINQMTLALRDSGGVLLLAGIRSLVGTTTVLLNLAVAGARQRNKRVVLWEANLAKAGLAGRLGLESNAGVADVLGGGAGLEKVILESPVPGLYVLPAQGDTQTGSSSLCTPEAARWLVSWLRDRFDLVLIDGPNLDNTLALGILAPLADDLYLVAPQTEKHLVHPGLAQTVACLGGRLRGLIHTQFEV